MAMTHDRPDGSASPPGEPWQGAFANGVLCALVAATLLWIAFRESTPPPEEPESVHAALDESREVIRWIDERDALMRERSRITDAIDLQIETLKARRALGGGDDETDAEIRRLQAAWHDEMQKSIHLLRDSSAAWDERERQRNAPRREQVARAAWEWERHRKGLLAMSTAAWALAGWLLWQAYRRSGRRPEAPATEAVVPPPVESLAAAARADSDAGDPQRWQKIPFYVLQVTVCGGLLLFGILGADRHFDRKNPRDMYIVLGLFGLATSTLWFFFGTIDWSTRNAIKDRVKGGHAAGDADAAQHDRR